MTGITELLTPWCRKARKFLFSKQLHGSAISRISLRTNMYYVVTMVRNC